MPTHRQFILSVICFATSIMIAAGSATADDESSTSPPEEAELLAVLRSDAPPAQKAITCKLLAIHGSSEAVGDLAPLLADEQLASWARIALEAIPGAAADEALRYASESLEGKLLVGTINSIGVRRDAGAVDLLISRLEDNDSEVASAAAVALGRIGNGPASKSLRQSLAVAPVKVRSAVAEGCVLCAEQRLSDGNSAEAVAIYDEVRNADVPRQRILEATRGAILARSEAGIPLLVEQFRSEDKDRFQIALSTFREFPGGEVDRALASEMASATPDRAALIVQAMADREETVVLAAVLKAAEAGPRLVRLAAIEALARVGDATCLSALTEIGLGSDADLSQAAKATLAELPGEDVDARIVERLSEAEGAIYPLLIELVGRRRIDAVPVLLDALNDADRTVRGAALIALGETVDLERLDAVISQVIAPKHPEDVATAQQALHAACIRMPDREACAAELAAAVEQTSSVPTKSSLLRVLGAVGGTKALEVIGAAAKSTEAELQDTSTRLLGQWMTEDAAPVLIDLAESAPGKKYQVRALRGYIRIARQFDLPNQQRAEMCANALAVSRQAAERGLVLDVLKRYPSAEMFKLAIDAMQLDDLKVKAAQATWVIAKKLGDKDIDVKELLSKTGLDKVELEIVKAQYGMGDTQKDVTATLQEAAGDVPLILLASANYNDSFGGDPVSGATKQLKIEYRIDGKPGEATFAENSLIMLPIPK